MNARPKTEYTSSLNIFVEAVVDLCVRVCGRVGMLYSAVKATRE